MIYISIFIATVLSTIEDFSKRLISFKFFYVIVFFIFCIVSLRYNSVDYFSYQRIYDDIGGFSPLGFFIYDLSEMTPVESGFALLIILEKMLFGDFFLFIAIFSLLSLIIKFSAFKKLSPYVLVSTLIYLSNEYFWKDLGQIRNAMASGIVLWAFYYAYQRRFLLFSFIVLLAGLFHSVAFVALPFYFVWWLRRRFFLIASLIIALFIAVYFGGIGSILVDIASMLGAGENSRILKYADPEHVSSYGLFSGTFTLQFFMCCVFVFFHKRIVLKWPISEFFIPIFIYSSCLYFVFIDYGIVAGRINEMITIPIGCVLLPTLILPFQDKSKIIPYIFIIFYCLLWFYLMMRERAPYQSVLQFLY
ncbi:EpsG family protein [Vibrio crassostreae]|uniref:EpsG family protein n=1 Tax=Vibrio crassostreae TaxID=246167 RepID=UPI001B31482E|nr:EpsG family protein [Vibrio crassostreae]